jgi:hypothetical protein
MKKTLLALALASTAALPVFAQDVPTTGSLNVELNKVVELEGGACRLTYVVDNGTEVDLQSTTYEMAIFNAAGAVSNMLLMEFGGIAAGKTRVIQFDVANQSCSDVSRILVNNQVDCATADGASTMCVDRLATKTLVENLEFTH